MGGVGDAGGDHGEFDLMGDAMGDVGGDIIGERSGEIGSNIIGDGDVCGCDGGVDVRGCLLCSSTSILSAVPRRVADLHSLLLLLLTTLSLRCSSSISVSSDVMDAGNILVSSLK